MKLKGKTAFVTGAGRGIGRAIALALHREGAQVVAADLLRDNALSVEREIREGGGEALAVQVDLTNRSEVERAVAQAVERFAAIDILVNNAGWDKLEPFLDSEEETWEKIIAINFKAVLYTSKAILPLMAGRGGKVINIASDAGRAGSSGEAVYAGTKGAVIAFSKTLAREMARYGINVNVVCPGLTETPLLQSIRDQSERARQEREQDAPHPEHRIERDPEDHGADVFGRGRLEQVGAPARTCRFTFQSATDRVSAMCFPPRLAK